MKNIIILQGISNSGKSTWAKQQDGYHIISRDAIRKFLLGGKENLQKYFSKGMDFQIEEYITTLEEQMLAKHISKNHKVIIDNCNLVKKYIQTYVNIFSDFDYPVEEVEIKTFPVELEEAIRRSKIRDEIPINENVIKKQFEQFKSACGLSCNDFIDSNNKWISKREKKKWHYTNFDIMPYKTRLKSYVICDLDGTSSHRQILENDRFYMRSFYDYESAYYDRPDSVVKFILHSLFDMGIKIIFVSGRKESSRKFTEAFIEDKLLFSKNDYKLFMREDGDNRSDDIVKYEIFNRHLRKLPGIFAVFDDRKRVIAMWEELGIKVMNCGALNEEF